MSDSPPETDTKKRKSKWPKKTIILILLIAGFVLAAPYGISYGIKEALIAAGADDADIEKVHFNPWTGNLVVERMAIDVGELPTVVVKEAGVNIDWSELFHRHFVVERIHVTDTDVHIRRNADGSINVIGIEVLPASEQTEAATQAAQAADEPIAVDQETGTPILTGAGLTLLKLTDISLSYEDPLVQTLLVIDTLEVEKVHSWQADQVSKFKFTGSINEAPVTIEADILAFGEDQRSVDARLTVDGLDLNAFEKIAQPALEALGGTLGIDTEIKAVLSETALHLRQNGDIKVDGVGIALPGTKVNDEALNWSGLVVVDMALGDDAGAPEIEVDGTLDSGKTTVALSEPALNVDNQGLSWNGKVKMGPDGVASLSIEGGAELKQTAVEVTGAVPVKAAIGDLAVSGLALSGTDRIKVGGIKGSSIEAEVAGAAPVQATLGGIEVGDLSVEGGDAIGAGSIKLSEAKAVLPGDKPMDATVGDLNVSGLKVSGGDNISAGSIVVNGTRLTDQASGIALGVIGSIDVDNFNMAGTDSIEVASVKAGDLRGVAGKDDDQVFIAKALTVTTIAIKELTDLSFDTIELADSNTTLSRLEDGRFHLLDDLAGSAAPTEPAAAAETQQPAAAEPEPKGGAAEQAPAETASAVADAAEELPFRLRVNELRATGENAFYYKDAGVTPKADIELIIDEFSFHDADSGAPDKPNKFVLAARVGKYGKIDAKGDLRPISRPPVADLALKVDALDMKIISPFLVRALGYQVESGAMDLDTTFKVDPKGEMTGENKIKITQLVVEPGDEKVMGEMAAKMPMPLDKALDLLRDDNNIIELEIPISGNINDPNVDFSDAIGTVVGKAVGAAAQAGAMSYLGAALFPYGTLLTVAKMGMDHMGGISLDPIIYPNGSDQAPETSAEYLGKVAGILTKDDKFNLRLCPFYTLADARALATADGATAARSPLSTHKDQVIELSKTRAETLKERLINEHQVSPKRVLVCAPEFDDTAEAKARVDLLL